MKRKLFAIILALLIATSSVFALCGCSQPEQEGDNQTKTEEDVNGNTNNGSNGGSGNDSGGSSGNDSGNGEGEGETIIDAISFSASVIGSFGSVPEPWTFLPESFSADNKAISSEPVYEKFCSVSDIPTNGIGKQLSVVYELLNYTEKALSYVRSVYSALGGVQSLYADYVKSNSGDYKSFFGTVVGITFALSLTETEYAISANVRNIGVSIFANPKTNAYGAKIQLAENTALKYAMTNERLTIAMVIADVSATQIEFYRQNGSSIGLMHEYLVVSDKILTATSALIHSDSNYTYLVGTKGDFIPTSVSRNCEVYSSKTGEFIGSEVREELSIGGVTATYNTLWYPLNKIAGINSVRKEDEMNGTNADTIYINGATTPIKSSHVKWPINKAGSRKFDIEFKKTYFYKYDSESEKYKEITCEIPMVFVQAEQIDDFVADFFKANKSYLSGDISLNVSSADKKAVDYAYTTLLDSYDSVKDGVTFDDIKDFCKS